MEMDKDNTCTMETGDVTMETGRGREGDVTKETESRWIKIIHVPWRQEMLLWRLEEGGRCYYGD